MQARVKGRNLFFEVIVFDLRNIPNIESIVSQSTEKAKNPAFFSRWDHPSYFINFDLLFNLICSSFSQEV